MTFIVKLGDENIYQDNLNDRNITPTKQDLQKLAISKTADLLASIQNKEEFSDE